MNRKLYCTVVVALVLLVSIGCTSGSFELGEGGPNLHLEYDSTAKGEESEPEMVEETTPTVKGELPSLAEWDQSPEDFTNIIGDRVTIQLPPNGYENSAWGLGVYTTDSAIGTAAVHMGLITFKQGGTVTIEITEGRTSYGGVLRNGVLTGTYESWPLSFHFIDGKGNPITLAETGGLELDWLTDASVLGLQEGESILVSLPSNGEVREIWGSDPYTIDSSIGTAAVHAGLLTFEDGGEVLLKRIQKRTAFNGSEKNGVESFDYEGAMNAYSFVK